MTTKNMNESINPNGGHLTSDELRELAAKAQIDVAGALVIAFNKGVARGLKGTDRKVIDVSELSLAYSEVDDSLILVGDLITEFFDQCDTETKDGRASILYGFARARAWATSLGHQLGSAKKMLDEMGASR